MIGSSSSTERKFESQDRCSLYLLSSFHAHVYNSFIRTVFKMPSGKEFSSEVKTIVFRVIAFVDSEKNGPRIAMNNADDRLHVMLGLSRHSISNLRQEMAHLIEQQKRNEEEDLLRRPRWRITSDAQLESRSSASMGRKGKHTWRASSIAKVIDLPLIPSPISPRKKVIAVGRKWS